MRLSPGGLGTSARFGLAFVFCGVAAGIWSCSTETYAEDEDGPLDADELRTATRTQSGTYTVYGATLRYCSTGSVSGLSEQLIAEMNCINPGEMERIDAIDGVSLNDAVFPYLQSVSAKALRKVATKKPGLMVNSALRALPQQYMLYRWSLRRRCGVERAATPGTSQHESGLAVDLQNWSSMRITMEQNDYDWFGYSDNVHFTFKGEGAVDVSGDSIRAFVRLWNRNHPEDPLAQDTSRYTNSVALRLMASPSEGFAKGPTCTLAPARDAGAVGQ